LAGRRGVDPRWRGLESHLIAGSQPT